MRVPLRRDELVETRDDTMSELARVPEEQPEGRPQYVDWEFAKSTGRRLVSAGPRVTPSEAAAIVGELREAAAAAREPIASTSRLHSPADAPPVLVVDRAGLDGPQHRVDGVAGGPGHRRR